MFVRDEQEENIPESTCAEKLQRACMYMYALAGSFRDSLASRRASTRAIQVRPGPECGNTAAAAAAVAAAAGAAAACDLCEFEQTLTEVEEKQR